MPSYIEKRFARIFNEMHRLELDNLVISILGGGVLGNDLQVVGKYLKTNLYGLTHICSTEAAEIEIIRRELGDVVVE